MQELFEHSFGGGGAAGAAAADSAAGARPSTAPSHKPLIRAPSGRFVHLAPGPPSLLRDGTSGEEWALPQGGAVKPYKGRTCPLCAFELLIFSPIARGPSVERA